jgi:3-oxoadipate enol-lactonase
MPTSYVTLGGVRLCYHDAGSGPVLVLLHGFPLNHTMWNAQIVEFSRTHRVIAPDLRGQGESAARPGRLEDMAEDVALLVDALGVARFALCGLSMGGYVAFALRRRVAHRLDALILADTRASADTRDEAERRAQLAHDARARGAAVVADAYLPRLLAPATYREQPGVVEAVRQMMRGTSIEGAVHALDAMRTRPDFRADLPHIARPTLVVVGAEDAVTPPAIAREMAAAIPGAATSVIAGAGHLAPMEQPAAFNAALREFLSTRVATTGR